ncbi:TetR family transcriptional regulator [Reticulibacter mediterranei]|uniref:TetR family transcriptional regulator n=1 Tax=Reticulibacter mediterranei TaxID=2778369 RepID=A0A8J3N365_9CHLR|nr:TetR/AcrR family transcriptional regulator C-terminal domain-containing protein [Reticulibacter mediterranei]GHO92822.1 TetR family transcriptional regulator [Reticulibacter mediterranei]
MLPNTSQPPEDLRVRRTHKLLWEALLSLLEQRPLESISVTEICEKAMVHRVTFYKHFEDKYDLLEYGLQATRMQLIEELHQEETSQTKRKHIRMLEQIAKHQRLYSLMMVEKETHSLPSLMRQQLTKDIETDLKQAQEKGIQLPMPPEVMAQFYGGAIVTLGGWWLENGMSISIEELARYLDLLLPDTLVSH